MADYISGDDLAAAPGLSMSRPVLPTSGLVPVAADEQGGPDLSAFSVDEDLPVPAPVAAPERPAGLSVAAPVGLPVAAPSGLPVAAPSVVAAAPVAPPVVAPPVVAPPVATPVPASPLAVAPPVAAPMPPVVAPVQAGPGVGPALPPPASTPGMVEVSEETAAEQRIVLDDLLMYMVEAGGSDLHLAAGSPPVIRVRGDMTAIPNYGPLTPKALQDAMYSVMNEKQQHRFEEKKELDFAYTVPGQARFRVNVLRQQGSVGAVMRTIPWEIKSLDELNMPEVIGRFPDLPRGLVLVTGPTGSGKSTTLAAMVDKANRTRRGHIITIEDPVEFLHPHRGCVVNQREVGEDTHSFADALKHVLRQDPDIILVGELRDLETISVALTAAETGHLVFATLHTQSAQETITRIVDVFPPEQQQQVRTQLAASLQGVVCQTLCKTRDGKGRAAAVEVMVCTNDIRSQIRENKLQQIQSSLQTGQKHGSQTLNMHLATLVKTGKVSYDEALEKCANQADFVSLAGTREEVNAALRQMETRMNTGMHVMGGM